MIRYDGRLFRAVDLTSGSDVNADTIFSYHQRGSLLIGEYSGGDIDWGSIVGRVNADGSLKFLYHHTTKSGDLRSGECESQPERMPSGKLRLHEAWQWHGGAAGTSILEEI